MDLGEYDTNTLLINNVSSVSFRVYEPAWLSSAYTFAASDVEKALRLDGHLVYADAIRRGIWCFYLLGRDGSSLSQQPPVSLGPTLDVCGYKMSLVDEGGFEPISLLRTRPPGTNAMNTPNSSSSAGSALDSSARGQAFGSFPAAHPGGGILDFPGKHESKGYASVPAKEMYDYFVSAVLASLSTTFCARLGAIALNTRSVLLPASAVPSNDKSGIGPSQPTTVLATFRIYLTTTGSLVISLGLSAMKGLMSSAEGLATQPLHARVPVLVAPFGTFATLHGVEQPGHGLPDLGFAQSPATQITRYRQDVEDHRIARLRSDCSKILEMRGIPSSVLAGTPWVRVYHPRRRPDGKRTPGGHGGASLLFWPAVLCFQKPSRADRMGAWSFDQSSMGRGLDPLADASAWLLGSEERDALFSKRQKERDLALAKEGGDGPGRTLQPHPDGFTPSGLRRPSNSNGMLVAGAMYPTPPDVVQNPTANPGFLEGVVASPSHGAPHNVPASDSEVAIAAPGGNANESFSDGWDATDSSKRADPELPDDMGMGADIFGDNAAITDADFSFFDEPGGGDFDFSGMPDMSMNIEGDPRSVTSAPAQHIISQKTTDNPAPAPIPSAITSPVFAKPELKHARSSLGDDARATSSIHDDRNSRQQQALGGIKRHPSPFNPDTVFKRVKASLEMATKPTNGSSRSKEARRGSVFEKVDFDPYMALNNEKYQKNGRFEIRWEPPNPKDGNSSRDRNGGGKSLKEANFKEKKRKENQVDTHDLAVPDTPYLRRRKELKDMPTNAGLSALYSQIRITSDSPQAGSIQQLHHQQQSPAKASTVGRMHDEPGASDADDSSVLSDPDDPSDPSDDEPLSASPTKSIMAGGRRRPAEDDAISLAASLREFETVGAGGGGAMSPQVSAVSVDLSRFASNELPELPLARYFAELEPAAEFQGLASDEDFVMVAQILTEQAASGQLHLTPALPESDFLSSREARRSLALCVRRSVQELRLGLPLSLGAAAECQFKPLLDVQDVPLLGQPGRNRAGAAGAMSAGAPGGGAGGPGAEQTRPNLFPIPAPHLEMRRHDSQLSLLPSAVDFWESLGLGPSQGPKDALAVCVFPEWPGMTDHVENFLNRMRNVYESFKLGNFDRLPAAASITGGLVAYEPDSTGGGASASGGMMGIGGDSPASADMHPRSGGMSTSHSSPMTDRMATLSQALLAAATSASAKNMVVYYIYSPSNPASIVECCAAFQRLTEHYQKLLILADKRQQQQSGQLGGAGLSGSPNNALCMQLVALDTVAERASLAIPPPSEYARLCLETYDRCTLFDGGINSNSNFISGRTSNSGPTPAPAVALDQPPPRMIDFKLTSEPTTNVLYENSCMHVAYAQSVDDRWVTVAWTDTRGIKQMTASYCLGRRTTSNISSHNHNPYFPSSASAPPRGGTSALPWGALSPRVAQEIWETTEELISAWRVHWHVVITKCGGGAMEAHEAELWTRLQQQSSTAASETAASSSSSPLPSISLSLLSVDTDPSLHIVPPPVRIPPSTISTFYTTPVSTPQPSATSMMSPDQSGAGGPPTPKTSTAGMGYPPTPGGADKEPATADMSDAAADAVLVDATDITWGAVLSHRLNGGSGGGGGVVGGLSASSPSPSSAALLESGSAAPILASGYLIKRGGGLAEDPPVVMEVCVVQTEMGPRMAEPLLREMLADFRALGTLARARGTVDRDTDVRPWHVAAAEKGVHAVYQLM